MEIALTQGFVAICDDADAAFVVGRKWFAHRIRDKVYAGTCIGRNVTHMHRLLLAPPPGLVVDHRNGDGLDNRRANIRIATAQQNSANSRAPLIKNKTSKYKGVVRHSRSGDWHARIIKDGRTYSLGLFKSEKAAALAYNRAARRLFGEFARTNEVR